MAKITLFNGDLKQDYFGAHDVSVTQAGVLTFYWEDKKGGPNASGYKITTSVPFVIEEDIAVG